VATGERELEAQLVEPVLHAEVGEPGVVGHRPERGGHRGKQPRACRRPVLRVDAVATLHGLEQLVERRVVGQAAELGALEDVVEERARARATREAGERHVVAVSALGRLLLSPAAASSSRS
jgi:hypothetical protein